VTLVTVSVGTRTVLARSGFVAHEDLVSDGPLPVVGRSSGGGRSGGCPGSDATPGVDAAPGVETLIHDDVGAMPELTVAVPGLLDDGPLPVIGCPGGRWGTGRRPRVDTTPGVDAAPGVETVGQDDIGTELKVTVVIPCALDDGPLSVVLSALCSNARSWRRHRRAEKDFCRRRWHKCGQHAAQRSCREKSAGPSAVGQYLHQAPGSAIHFIHPKVIVMSSKPVPQGWQHVFHAA